MHCATSHRRRPFSYHTKKSGTNSEKSIEYGKYSNSQIDKPQRGRPKRAELPDVNINTGAQSINTEKIARNKRQKKT